MPRAEPFYVSSDMGCATTGCASLFLGAPLVGATVQAFQSLPLAAAAAVAASAAAVPVAIGLFFAGDTEIFCDELGLRVVHYYRLGPMRGRVRRVDLDFRWDAVHEAKELRKHQPSKNGGWTSHHAISFGKLGRLDAALLGGPATEAYRGLIERVRTYLGPRFSAVDDFGPMNDAMKRLVQAELAKRDARG